MPASKKFRRISLGRPPRNIDAAAAEDRARRRRYCAATLANLATDASVHADLLPPREAAVADALGHIATHHASEPTVMLLCQVVLARLSDQPGGEDGLIASCIAVLVAGLQIDAANVRKVAFAAVANLLPSAERNQLVEHLVPTIKYLSQRPDDFDGALIALAAIRNLSHFDVPRIALVEGGGVVLLAALFYRALLTACGGTEDSGPTGAPRAEGLLKALAESYLNLTCAVDGRERMIKDGAVKALADVEHLAKTDATKELVGLAVSNLTGAEVANMLPTVLAHGAVPTLVAVAARPPGFSREPRLRVAAALSNLSAEPSAREALVAQDAHSALKTLSDEEAPTSATQELVLVAYVNLLAVPANQRRVVDGGVLDLLRRLSAAPGAGASTRKLVGKALANVASDLAGHTTKTQSEVLEMMTSLANNSGLELERIIASAFAMFAHIMTETQDTDLALTDANVATMIGLCIREDAQVLKFAGIALHNLSQADKFHGILFRNDIPSALVRLAASRDDDVRRTCASACRALTGSDELDKAPASVVQGFVDVVAALDSCRAADVINFSAASLFSITCVRRHNASLLLKDASTLRRLFGMMRGGQESTQLYAARALCNLTCEASCVTILLKEKAIADFIAIAILRTNNEEVKGVCAECLFNLLRGEKTRPQLVKEPNNVLWAIGRLFRVESERTQRIGALVVYNLSCDPGTAETLMDTINAAETLASVALHAENDFKSWAAAALCNLSWRPDFATRLVHDAAVHHRAQRDHASGGRGIIKVLRHLCDADVDSKADIEVKGAVALHNMALCSPEVSERLVDDGLTPLLERFLASEQKLVPGGRAEILLARV